MKKELEKAEVEVIRFDEKNGIVTDVIISSMYVDSEPAGGEGSDDPFAD